MKHAFLSIAMLSLVPSLSFAQTTSSVSGPGIDAGEREIEYRFAAGFGEVADNASFAHRLHYQASVSDALRWRLRALWRDPNNGPIELDHIQAELHWQWIEPTANGYSSGFRVNLRGSSRDNDADEFGVTWLNEWAFAPAWRVRAMASVDQELGADASHDWMLETRFGVRRELTDSLNLGIESFNDFSDEAHQIGPVVSGELFGNVDWSKGVLFGLSDGADEVDLMIRLSRAL